MQQALKPHVLKAGVLLALLPAFLVAVHGLPAQSQPSPQQPRPANPMPTPGADAAYFVGPHVSAPQFVKLMAAGYPSNVPLKRIAGQTVLTLIVGVDGRASSIEVVQSHGESFDAAAMNAVKLSQFAPGTLAGKPVPVRIDIQVPFHASLKQAVPVVLIAERDLPPPAPLPQGKRPPSYTAPIPIHTADADFSGPAAKNAYVMVALVTVLVSTEGLPVEVRVVRGLGFGMDEKAVAAVRKWRFVPATSKGKIVAERRNVEVKFILG